MVATGSTSSIGTGSRPPTLQLEQAAQRGQPLRLVVDGVASTAVKMS